MSKILWKCKEKPTNFGNSDSMNYQNIWKIYTKLYIMVMRIILICTNNLKM